MCTTSVPNERTSRIAFESKIAAEFIDPLLKFSDNNVIFKYMWEPEKPISSIYNDLYITNISKLPTQFYLKTQPPFNINNEYFELNPNEQCEVCIDFDPGQKLDKVSAEIPGKLLVIHKDHPQKDSVELTGSVNFPNLTFEISNIDFGCILPDTTKKI